MIDAEMMQWFAYEAFSVLKIIVTNALTNTDHRYVTFIFHYQVGNNTDMILEGLIAAKIFFL